jgi:hypothetical protein
MATCWRIKSDGSFNESDGIPLTFCPPDTHILMMSNDDFSSYSDYENYSGSVYCMSSGGSWTDLSLNSGETFPCSADRVVVDPVEFMTFFEIEAGYGIIPEVFVMTQDQIDLILTSMLVMTMCIACCLGFLANESSAK